MDQQLSVRELTNEDIPHLMNYWLTADDDFLTAMGVDLVKMPPEEKWLEMLSAQLTQTYADKQSYAIIWLIEGKPVGHCNINKIVFGAEAYMHLHMWHHDKRQKGLGASFIKLALPYFFKNMQLKELYCEPYSLNPAPNKTLQKLGFEFVKAFTTIPGWLNFEQEVNLWKLPFDKYKAI